MEELDYKGVWIFAEQREGILQKISLELLGCLLYTSEAETVAVMIR